jgi:hypothetical protein
MCCQVFIAVWDVTESPSPCEVLPSPRLRVRHYQVPIVAMWDIVRNFGIYPEFFTLFRQFHHLILFICYKFPLITLTFIHLSHFENTYCCRRQMEFYFTTIRPYHLCVPPYHPHEALSSISVWTQSFHHTASSGELLRTTPRSKEHLVPTLLPLEVPGT